MSDNIIHRFLRSSVADLEHDIDLIEESPDVAPYLEPAHR
jgi:hypothetical protein